MNMITQFCFPDKEKFPKHQLSPKSRKFTFVVTNVDGVKRFGYVRRSLTGQISISNQGKRWPICHCILSVFPCHSIFDQILEATSRLEPQNVLDLMTQLQHHSLPAPGDAIYATVATGDPTAPRLEPFRFSRPEQESSLSGFADFKTLLTTIDPFTIASILIALLMERRVIFISRKLSTLSSCVQACVALLYPFSWQHVFIPVLPLAMIQFVCAPVPFVVGLLASHLPELQAQSELMEEVLLIDVESSSPVPPSQDYRMVPEKYLLPLVATIAKARKIVCDEKKKSKSDKSVGDKLKHFFNSDKNSSSGMGGNSRTTMALQEYYKEAQPTDNVAKMIENAFISFFAETMGHYTNYLTATEFDKDAFLTFDPTLEPFLRGVGGSQLFEQFIVQRQASSRIKNKTQPALTAPPKRAASSTQADPNSDAKLSEVIVREGYISKWGKGMKGTAWARIKEGKDHRGTNHEGMVGTFQLRYWKLSYFTLSYHKSEDSKPSGSIALQDIVSVNMTDFRGVHDCIEIATAERVYQLHTDNNADMMWWMELLNYKVALLREYYGNTSSSSSKSSLAKSAESVPTRSSTAPASTSMQWTATTQSTASSHSRTDSAGSNGNSIGAGRSATEAPPASVPPLSRSQNGGSKDSIASPGPNRAASKTIVSSYMKERVAAQGSDPTSPRSGPTPPPKPEKYHSHPTHSLSASTPSYGAHHSHQGAQNANSHGHGHPQPSRGPSSSQNAVDASNSGLGGATRNRSTAMRSTSQTDAPNQAPTQLVRAESMKAPIRPNTEHPSPTNNVGGGPLTPTTTPPGSKSLPLGSRPQPGAPPSQAPPKLSPSISSRQLKRVSMMEDSANSHESPETAEQEAIKANVINRLSLSPPKVRPLPPTPARPKAPNAPSFTAHPPLPATPASNANSSQTSPPSSGTLAQPPLPKPSPLVLPLPPANQPQSHAAPHPPVSPAISEPSSPTSPGREANNSSYGGAKKSFPLPPKPSARAPTKTMSSPAPAVSASPTSPTSSSSLGAPASAISAKRALPKPPQ